MNNNFINKSKFLLLQFLREPWGFSFFPSSFFWSNDILADDITSTYKSYFNSEYVNIDDSNNKLNLYIHIPFCTKICSYCNCFKRLLKQSEEIDKYLNYLDKESKLIFELNNSNKIRLNSIFIWWWTPNLLSISQFEKLNNTITNYFDLSILEQFLVDGHPNHYSKEKIDYLKQIWVNRVTLAVQTFDENTLKQNNRDVYNKIDFEFNINYLSNKWIKSNIDLLIWLKWQTFESIKADIDYLNSIKIDNVSVHYLMKSNNINYYLDGNYLVIVSKTKEYLKNNPLAHNSSNITEDYYASKRNSTISIWASAITNIYSEFIYSKPWINNYYNLLDNWKIPFYKWVNIWKKDEMIRYIYLNILYWVNINTFNELFWKDIFKMFIWEFKFLNSNKIIYIRNNIIYSNKNDLETLIYFNIFFLEKFGNFSLNSYNSNELNKFFLESWELIDK